MKEDAMEMFRKGVSIGIGGFLVIGGIIDECPRVATVAVGLLLMGAFTVPEAIGFIKGGIGDKRD
jgi:hypothetical protein